MEYPKLKLMEPSPLPLVLYDYDEAKSDLVILEKKNEDNTGEEK